MRALHVFPLFGEDRTSGSDYYQFMLTRELVRQGTAVDVYTTRSRRIEPRAAFGLGWPAEHPAGCSEVDGVPVHRFRAALSLPSPAGHALSRVILRRWQAESARDGAPGPAAADAIDLYERQARSRPLLYDALAMFGRGPHPPGLLAAAWRRAAEYDVILAGFSPFATLWYLTALGRRTGTPVVLLPLFHPEDRYHHFRSLYWAFAHADALIAQTPYSAALFQRLAPGSNPVQVGAGVDPAEYDDVHCDGQRFRARYGLRDARIVLLVGRKEFHKRYDLAVEAVQRIGREDVALVMIGTDIDRAPIGSRHVRYLGPLPRADLLDAYDACDVFVLPSDHESFGIVFLEAWMRGKPVIGNAACQPVRSVIDDGRDGFLAADPDELAARIRMLLADPDLARALGAAGHAKVLERYTWSRIAARVRGIYEDVVSRRPLAKRPASPRQDP